MTSQEMILVKLEDELDRDPPKFGGAVPLCDEIGERMSLRIGNLRVVNTWEGLGFPVEFIWWWDDPSKQPHYFRAVITSMLLTNKG